MILGLFTDDFYPFIGGMGRYVYEVTQRLPDSNLIIFSPCNNDIPNHVQVNPPIHHQFRNLSYSFWLHRNVKDIVRKYRLSRLNIQCGPGGLFLLRSTGVPVVATCYHTWWQQSHYIGEQVWKKIFLPFEQRTYHLADKIICISEDSHKVLVDKYGVAPDKLEVIHPGVDITQFYPVAETQKIPNSVLYVGRVDKRKGTDFLIRSLPYVVERIPEVQLYIGGKGKDLAKLKQYVCAQGLSKNVEFLGFIPDDQINLWYNRVQCVVVPSVFEGFGLTAVESMAAGTSVICTRVDSLRHIVQNSDCGYLVDYGDTSALGKKIVSLLRDEQKQNEFSQKGRQAVKYHYNWDTQIKKLAQALLGTDR
ncbi:MAG: glycosyltransferase family 4 protein [Desulfobacterales bacterium]|jgi:glycosyltransferase involved in cell wall biosynthesis